MFYHFFKTAVRNLIKSKYYTSLNIIGFSIGFAAVISIGLFAYSELSVDTCFADYERIYKLIESDSLNNKSASIDYDISELLETHFPEVEIISPYNLISYDITLKSDQNVIKVNNIISTTNKFFDLLSLNVIAQSSQTPFSDKNSVVISESLSKKLFGETNPIGKPITISLWVKFDGIVTAVIKDMPKNSSTPADLFINAEYKPNIFSRASDRKGVFFPLGIYLKLKNGFNPETLTSKINSSIGDYQNRYNAFELQPISQVYLFSKNIKTDMGGENKTGNLTLLIILISIACLILILSIANYAVYSISQFRLRIKSIGIRKVNGASKPEVFYYFLSESVLSNFISMALTIILLSFLMPYISGLLGQEIHIKTLLEFKPLIFLIIFLFIIIQINTLIPFWSVLSIKNINSIKEAYYKRHSWFSTNTLTIFQFTVAMGLLMVLFFMNKQINYAKYTDWGFQKDNVICFPLGGKTEKQEILKEYISDLSFVQGATLSNGLPGIITYRNTSNSKTEQGDDIDVNISVIFSDTDFLKTFNLTILEKLNNISKKDVCFINETAFKAHQWETIYGKRISGLEIIGIVKDFNINSFHQKIHPLVIRFDLKKDQERYLSVRLMKGNFSNQIAQMENAWKKVIPDYPMEFSFIEETLNSKYKKEEKLGKAIKTFSFIAFALVFFGLVGQIVQNSINKTKEIGIRKINGANIFDILINFNYRFINIVLISFMLSMPVSYLIINKWLENFAYKISVDWWTFTIIGISIIFFTVIIVTLQSWRTIIRNPVESIRHE